MTDLTIKAIIFGNHQKQDGNPLPKPRMTRSAKWGIDARANRYFDYMRWFRREMLKASVSSRDVDNFNKVLDESIRRIRNSCKLNRAPFTSSKDQEWHIKLWLGLKGEKRGDTDNIIKSVKDILFTEDKYAYCYLQPVTFIDKKSTDKPFVKLEMVRKLRKVA